MECEKCGSDMWDNRNNKRSARAPDYRCKDGECGHKVWLTPKGGGNKGGGNGAAAGDRPKKPHAMTYQNCMAFVVNSIAPKMKEKGFVMDTGHILTATATLFIAASHGGPLLAADKPAAAPPPPPPPPPPPVQDEEDDLPF